MNFFHMYWEIRIQLCLKNNMYVNFQYLIEYQFLTFIINSIITFKSHPFIINYLLKQTYTSENNFIKKRKLIFHTNLPVHPMSTKLVIF